MTWRQQRNIALTKYVENNYRAGIICYCNYHSIKLPNNELSFKRMILTLAANNLELSPYIRGLAVKKLHKLIGG